MKATNDQCPFKVGDQVIYWPSARGVHLDVMSSSFEKLIPGNEYTVEHIQEGVYVVVNGYYHPGGGLYWTEFKKGKQRL